MPVNHFRKPRLPLVLLFVKVQAEGLVLTGRGGAFSLRPEPNGYQTSRAMRRNVMEDVLSLLTAGGLVALLLAASAAPALPRPLPAAGPQWNKVTDSGFLPQLPPCAARTSGCGRAAGQTQLIQ